MGLGYRIIVLVACIGWSVAVQGEPVEPTGKAGQYYRILQKRPRPGYLFERFCNSWLEEHEMQELEALLESRRDSVSGALLLSFYYDRTGRPAEAREMCDAAIEQAPDQVPPLYYRAQLSARLGQYADAARDLETVVAAESDLYADAMKLLARTYIRQGRAEEGLACLETLRQKEPGDTDLQDEMIDLQIEEGLYNEALESCDGLMATTKNAQYRMMLALRKASILSRLERTGDSLDTLDAALGSVAAGSWIEREVLRRIGRVYRTQQNLSGLVDHYARLLEGHPGNLQLLRHLASVSAEVGDHEAALEQGRELLRLAPQDEEIREFYVNMLEKAGRHAEAIKIVAEMLANQPDHNELRIRLAGLHAASGDSDAVRTLILEYLDHSKGETYDYFRAARALVRMGESNDATQIYLQCLERYPESVEALEELVYHMVREGLYHLVSKHLEALQQKGDESMLLRVANQLCSAQQGGQAYAFLNGRLADFEQSPRYLEALYQTLLAMPEDERSDGMELAMKWLRTSDTLAQMYRASFAVLDESRRIERQHEVRSELEGLSERTLPETYLLSRMYVGQGDLDLAWKVIDDGLAQAPDDALLWEIRLEQATAVHDRARAMECLRRLQETAPKRRTIWMKQLADLMFEASDFDGALALLQQWKEISSANPQIYLRESRILMAQDKGEEAVLKLRRAAFRFPESPELKLRLAELYAEQGRLMEAEQVHWSLVDSATELDDRLSAFNGMLSLLRRTDRMDAVMEELKDRIEANRADVFPQLALAECYRVFGDSDARTEALLKVLELRPDDVRTMRIVARSEMEAGEYDRAYQLMQQIAGQERDTQVLLDMAKLLLSQGDLERGMQMLTEECRFENSDGLVDAAEMLLTLNAYEEVETLLADRLDDFPDDYRIPFMYAVVLEEAGRYSPAAEQFMRLLNVKGERAGVVPMRYVSDIGEWIPMDELPSLRQLMMIMEYESGVYAYRNGSRYYSGAGNPCPQRFYELEPYVVNHLRQLHHVVDAEMQERIVLGLQQADIPYTDLMLTDDVDYFSSSPEWWFERIESNGGDVDLAYLLAVIAMTEGDMSDGFLSAEQRARLYEILEPDFPNGALCALLSAGELSDAMKAYIPELLPRCADKGLALASSQQAISMLFQFFKEEGMTEALKSAFLNYARAIPDNAVSMRYDMLIMLEEYDAIVEDVAARYAAEKRKSAYSRYTRNYSASRASDSISPLSFPPEVLIPEWLNTRDFSHPEEGLAVAIRKIDDPVLRLCLLISDLNSEERAELIAEIEEKVDAGFDKNLLLGSWYSVEQDSGKALEYLIRARHAAPTTELRKSLDGAILNRVLYLDTFDPEQQRECRAAVLRLSAQVLSRKDVVVMTELRRKLGMEEALPQKNMQAASMPIYSSGSLLSGSDRIARLIVEGKTNQVMREMRITLNRNLANRTMIAGYEETSKELNDLRIMLEEHELQERFVAFMKPEPEASPQTQLASALACEITGMWDEALAQYRHVLELRPQWSGVRYRVMTAMTNTPPAIEVLREMPPAQLEPVVMRLCREMDGKHPVERLHLCELLLTAIDALPKALEPYDQLQVLETLVGEWNLGPDEKYIELEQGLLDERVLPDEELPVPDEKLVATHQRRIEIFEAFCEQLLNDPKMGRIGFSAWEQYTRVWQKDRSGLLDRAEQVLLEQKQGYYAEDMNRYYGPSVPGDMLPEHFFAAECARSGRRDRFDRVVAAVQEARLKDELMMLGEAFFASGEAFNQLISEALTTGKMTDAEERRLTLLLKIYQERRETFDLLPLILKPLQVDDSESVRRVNDLFEGWMDLCEEMEREELFAPATKAYVAALFPAEVNEDEAADDDTLSLRLNQVRDMLRNSPVDAACWTDVMDLVAPHFQSSGRSANGYERYWRSQDSITKEMLLETRFFDDWETFNAYSYTPSYSLMDSVLDLVKSDEVLSNAVAAVDPPTFGSRLVGLRLKAGSLTPEALAGELARLAGDYHDRILASDEPHREELYNLWNEMQHEHGWDMDPALAPDGAARELFSDWMEREVTLAQEDADELLEKMVLEQAERSYSVQSSGSRLVRCLAFSDPAQCERLLDYMFAVKEMSGQISRSSSRYYEDVGEDTFEAVCGSSYPGRSAMKLLLEYAYKHDVPGGWFELNDAIERRIVRPAVKRRIAEGEADGLSKEDAQWRAAQETLVELDALTAPYGCPPVLESCVAIVSECGNSDRLREWLKSGGSTTLAHRDLYLLLLPEADDESLGERWIDVLKTGSECSAIRGMFTLSLYDIIGHDAVFREQDVIDAAYGEVLNLTPAQYLTTDGFGLLINRRPGGMDEKALYDAWRELTGLHSRSATRNKTMALALADLLLDRGRQPEAGMVLMACGDQSMSSLVMWSRLRNSGETLDAMQYLLERLNRRSSSVSRSGYTWMPEDAEWFCQQVENWTGDAGRFARLAALTVPLVNEHFEPLDYDAAAFMKGYRDAPFNEPRTGLILLEMAAPIAEKGTFDELICSTYTDELLRAFIKDAHGIERDRIEEYARMLVRMNDPARMRALLTLYQEHADEPEDVYEEKMRDVIFECAAKLNVELEAGE